MSSDTPWGRAEEAYKTRYPRKAEAVERAYATFPGLEESEYPAHPMLAPDEPTSSPESAAPEELPLSDGLPDSLMTVEEQRAAYDIGIRRYHAARERGANQRWGWLPTSQQRQETDGQSAVAEALVARFLDRAWLSTGNHPDDPKIGDVEGGVSVRWTPRTSGSLIIHEDEHPELYAVLVVGMFPDQRIVGWLQVRDCWQRRYWRTQGVRHPAFFVPQTALQPMAVLRAVLP